jgi:hypothetical protein
VQGTQHTYTHTNTPQKNFQNTSPHPRWSCLCVTIPFFVYGRVCTWAHVPHASSLSTSWYEIAWIHYDLYIQPQSPGC